MPSREYQFITFCVREADRVSSAFRAYNDPNPRGLQSYLNLISQRAKIEGVSFYRQDSRALFLPTDPDSFLQFIVFDYADRYHIAAEEMARYVRSGQLKLRETRIEGLDKCVEALVGIFEGKNTGKMLVKIGTDGAKL